MAGTTVDLGRVVGDTGPQGPTGATGAAGKDGYIPQFEIDENGDLWVITPDNVMQDVTFTLEADGSLYYEISED